jgi:hypothetical protein
MCLVRGRWEPRALSRTVAPVAAGRRPGRTARWGTRHPHDIGKAKDPDFCSDASPTIATARALGGGPMRFAA